VKRAALLFVCSFIAAGLYVPQVAAAGGFNTAAAASVWASALSYIAPRALIAASIPQMTVWGLNGLTALDPDLTASLQHDTLRLYGPNALILSLPAPAANDAAGWGRAAAQIAAAAYAASAPLQQAGTQGLISSFFDELFNHFDPYSRYEPPQQAAQDQLFITGLAGTGLTLGRQGAAVIAASVAVDSPAAEAGITPGTQITAIDGRPASPNALAQLNTALNGIPGTTTTLHAIDPDDAVPSDIMLTRAFIPPQTVFPADFPHPAPQVIGLKISSFNKGTSDNFSAALLAAMAAQPGAKFLLLDLRGNRGGILRQAVLLADSLLPAGTIATAAGRDPDADQIFNAEGADLTGGLPLIVLVDGQTASAAEILAAALADNRRAVVIGSETLGKGLVQTLTALPDGGELYVTWSRVLAPRGWPLQSLGLMPQICTSLGPQGVSSQLASLKTGRNLLTPTIAAARAARAPLPIDRILAIRDVCPAAIGGDLDFTAATALMASTPAYHAALLSQN
jgi:carboxyl-terminal processing protease